MVFVTWLLYTIQVKRKLYSIVILFLFLAEQTAYGLNKQNNEVNSTYKYIQHT